MFEQLRKLFIEEQEAKKAARRFYIENGFMESWAPEHRTDADNGIRNYSTDRRFEQYTAGEISREKAIGFAVKRMEKEIEKETAAGLEKLDKVAAAPDLERISVYVEWKRSRTWGYNPSSEVYTDNGRTAGYASGCGYDKESASVASAFNKDYSILKVLYNLKETGLSNGLTSKSDGTCTGHDNRNIIGYGAGYSVLPAFEGGVGVNCFWSILKKAGFEVSEHHGKHNDTYVISK